jgi:hypothetical protein
VAGVDIAILLSTTLRLITDRLGLLQILVVICTDSFSLYECLVKLGTTKEKRLIIDIMSIRQSYEERELSEIRWITRPTNLADSITKASRNPLLETLVSTNRLVVGVKG